MAMCESQTAGVCECVFWLAGSGAGVRRENRVGKKERVCMRCVGAGVNRICGGEGPADVC